MDNIGRNRLPHDYRPHFSTHPENEVYFITICCVPRGANQLATPAVWQAMEETLSLRETKRDLICRLALAMPDHFHGLFEFPGPKSMAKIISDFKSWLAKQCGIHWQRDFFDHRLRTIESASDKARYIRLNPVRAGLVTNPDDWPYQR